MGDLVRVRYMDDTEGVMDSDDALFVTDVKEVLGPWDPSTFVRASFSRVKDSTRIEVMPEEYVPTGGKILGPWPRERQVEPSHGRPPKR
jgi:hypothetical protein